MSYLGDRSQSVVGLNLVVGPNARGKTSILEAIYMLSQGRGFREEEELELLTFDRPSGFVLGIYQSEHGVEHEASITYQRIEESLQKKYFLDKAATSISKFRRSQIPAVLFAPHQLDIITHSPSYRREYLDGVIGRVDLNYGKTIREYESALRRRNAILEEHTDLQALRTQLDFWDDFLATRAAVITGARREYVARLNAIPHFADRAFKIVYHANTLTRERLLEKYQTEIAARRTLIGPQKDDLEILLAADATQSHDPTAFRNVARYGSRSQQRLALMWMKMYEISYLQESTRVRPILLLDDVFSEFDAHYQQLILELIPDYQTVMTSTQEDILLPTTTVSKVIKL